METTGLQEVGCSDSPPKKNARQQEIFIDEQVFEHELEDEEKVSLDFKPVQPDDVISDVELGASPIAKEESNFNEDQGQMTKEKPMTFSQLIFGAQLLRGPFSEDIFNDDVKEESHRPTFSVVDKVKPKVEEEEEVKLLESNDFGATLQSQKDEIKLQPSTKTDFGRHNLKVQEIVDMIQKNKNNYYFSMFMKEAK